MWHSYLTNELTKTRQDLPYFLLGILEIRHGRWIEKHFKLSKFQANIINRFGGVKIEKIRGLRVPFLKPGWNRQFLMMKEFGFVYDSSIPAPLSDPPIWPYTLDFKIPHKCIGRRKCPSRSFPGLWVKLRFFYSGKTKLGAAVKSLLIAKNIGIF